MNGVQLYLELIDSDQTSPDELIDRYILDLNITRGSNITRTNLRGVFNITELNITFLAQCMPGYTGIFCETPTQIPTTTAIVMCDPGYTGPDCRTAINNCMGVNCSNRGECVNTNQSFSCLCQPFYTGERCEMQLNGYLLLVSIDSYRNPESRCAGCPGSGCCDSNCDTGRCDTFFYLCTRPSGSEVVTSNLTEQGNCLQDETVRTGIDPNSDGRVFSNNFVLNTPNPIRFTGIPEVC